MIEIINYNVIEARKKLDKLFSRNNIVTDAAQKVVDIIVQNVKADGDAAVFKYTQKFDGFLLDKSNIRLSEEEIAEAYNTVDQSFITVVKKAVERIKSFHMKQKQNSWFDTGESGEILGQLVRPLEICGVYVPGGKAAYPSTVLMNVIPAQIAGVKKIIMATPCKQNGKVNPSTIITAVEAGITEIYKVGGAQAIAAMAYGTESIPKVDKIVGPGNIYVALAKRCVYGNVDIDSVAGPSEILVIADALARPDYIAADLLSQAEHDEMASAILVTDSEELISRVIEELQRQTEMLSRKDIIEKSLRDYGAAILVKDMEQAVEVSNIIAPEHLEVAVAEPFNLLPDINNAGAVFLGYYTTEPLGDYMAGPNHVLPTGGTARFYSPLSVDDFIKKTSVLSFTKKAMNKIGGDVVTFAMAEGLTAHANAVKIRMDAE